VVRIAADDDRSGGTAGPGPPSQDGRTRGRRAEQAGMNPGPRRRRAQTRQAEVADTITRFSGSFTFIKIHIVWFTLWIVLNLIPATTFDHYPFGLLTLIVSLEAIFLSTFVLISQNRSDERDVEREEDDLRVSVLTGVWAEQIGDKLGVSRDDVERLARDRLRQHHDIGDPDAAVPSSGRGPAAR
jgi:uncharacterized membrane protein